MKKREFKIHVTKLDIRKGGRACCHTCPVARALRRAFRVFLVGRPAYSLSLGLVSASADFNSCVVLKGGAVFFRLRKAVCEFIRKFDKRIPVEPIRFTVSVPISKLKARKA